MWILVVALERERLDAARRFLVALGHRVVTASNSAEAHAHLHLHTFDLVAADPEAARQPWAASLRDRRVALDIPLAVFNDPADLDSALRRAGAKNSTVCTENSAWDRRRIRQIRLAIRLLPVSRAFGHS